MDGWGNPRLEYKKKNKEGEGSHLAADPLILSHATALPPLPW